MTKSKRMKLIPIDSKANEPLEWRRRNADRQTLKRDRMNTNVIIELTSKVKIYVYYIT